MAAEIAAEFRRKLAGLQSRMMPNERAAAFRVFQDERDAAMRALRECRAAERYARRLLRRAREQPRP